MRIIPLALLLAATSFSVPAFAADPAPSTPSYRDRLPEDETIYFLLPDRFENGDVKNERGGLKGDRMQTGFDPAAKGFYHGGDLKGLVKRLDYIQSLGTTAIWLSPVFKNKPVQGAPGDESAGYHGYWVTDFTTVDPHLGTDADFKALVDGAHAKGMKVYMDIITNHSADVIQMVECKDRSCPYRSRADYPDKAYTPLILKGEEKAKVPAWMNDPKYYHNRGNSTFRGESSTMGDFVGLDDFATEDPKVVQGFIDVYGAWIDKYGIDGFRIDTAKHVNQEFWQAFAPAILARAKAKGIPNFHIFGEAASDGMDIQTQALHTRVAKLPSVLDFAFRRAVIDTVAGKAGTDMLSTLFEGDGLYEGGNVATLKLPTFLSNHDFGRFAREMRLANPQADDAEILKRVILGHAMLFTLRGVPTIYSGDEQGFTGDGIDQDAREDMFPSKVAVYNDNILIGTKATTADSNFDTKHPLYRVIAKLAAMRTNSTALRRGKQIVRNYSEKPGLFAVSRIDKASDEEVLVVFNTANEPLNANVEIGKAVTALTSIVGDCPAAARMPGSLAISLPPLEYMVCKVQ
jgi:neopullulanase